MISLIRGIFAVVLTTLILLFALVNRHDVHVFYSPLNDNTIEMPLSVIVLMAMGFGFVVGALLAWLGEAAVRRDRRHQKRRIKELEKELETIEVQDENQKPPSDFFPAILKK